MAANGCHLQRCSKLYEQRVAELQAFSNQRKLHPAPTSTASASSANLRQTRAGMDVCFEKWFSRLQLKTYAYDGSRGDKSFWDTHSGTLRKKSRELLESMLRKSVVHMGHSRCMQVSFRHVLMAPKAFKPRKR